MFSFLSCNPPAESADAGVPPSQGIVVDAPPAPPTADAPKDAKDTKDAKDSPKLKKLFQ